MKKTYYRCWYNLSATITTNDDGTATLRISQSGKTILNKKYKSEAVAKRVLSRESDGTYREVEQ